MNKYNISDEFGSYSKFSSPFNKLLFPISSLALYFNKKSLKSDNDIRVTVEKIKSYDNKEINIYIFEPINFKTDKVLLYMHGGGFAFRGYAKHYSLCRRYALEGNCKVVYVDYRLAPKHQYPIPSLDCFYAYEWIIKNANKLQIDINKIIVGGDSAGGCLAVDVTLKAIEENLVKPCYQLLIYPVLDKRMNTNSMKIYTDTPVWNAKLNKRMWKYYLGDKEYISPNEIEDLSNMPSTYIETAEYDCLHDEGIEFANKLINSGIKVTLYETKQTMHGFDFKDCPITEDAILNRIKALKSI